ncbi:unnamed protein product, partial [marine sediment metagenome]
AQEKLFERGFCLFWDKSIKVKINLDNEIYI